MEDLQQEPSAEILTNAKEWRFGETDAYHGGKIFITDFGVWIWRAFWQPAYEDFPEWGWEHIPLQDAKIFVNWPTIYWNAEPDRTMYSAIQKEIQHRLDHPPASAPRTLTASSATPEPHSTSPEVKYVRPNFTALFLCIALLAGGSFFFRDAFEAYVRGVTAYTLPEQSTLATYSTTHIRDHYTMRAKFVPTTQGNDTSTIISYSVFVDEYGKELTIMLEHATGESSVAALETFLNEHPQQALLVTKGTHFAYFTNVPAENDLRIHEGYIGTRPNDSFWWFLLCGFFLLSFLGTATFLILFVIVTLWSCIKTVSSGIPREPHHKR